MSRRRLRHSLHRRILRGAERAQRVLGGESTAMVVLGALTGVVSGLAAVGFVELVHLLNSLAWAGRPDLRGVVPEDVMGQAGGPPMVQVLALLAGGLVLVAFLTRKLAPEAEGHGVPDVMEAVARRRGIMRGRVGFVKLLTSSLTIGLGGSVGKEGPIVQAGAAFGSRLGRYLGVRGPSLRTLVGCGAAGGIAAVFNAPIGGVLFALEIIIGAYSVSAFAPVLIASVAGAVTAQRFLGDNPAFAIPEALKEGLTLTSSWEMGAYVGLGLLFGVLSVGFTRGTTLIEDLAHKLRAHWTLKAALAGIVVGLLGWLLPEIMGEGHHTVTELLIGDSTHLTWKLLLALALVKTLATAVTLGGGGSGGMFAPSLFVGAMLGGAFGQGLEFLFPGQVGSSGAYALAGMAALLAGTAHAPLTAFLLLFEMSDNYLLILPLMTVSVLSSVIAGRLMPDSIYTLPLSRRGIVLRDREDTALLKQLKVADAMSAPVAAIPDTTTFDRIVRRLLESKLHDIPVVDQNGRLTGAISLDDVREFLREAQLDHLLLARECQRKVTTIAPHASLLDAMELFEEHSGYEVPVVLTGRLVGSLKRADVLRVYRRTLVEQSRRASRA
ncbi:MAG: chloride channel protein [Planctomycetota bacterium]|nr:MAG: chloride channel protein [Planctomycetota bacterium]